MALKAHSKLLGFPSELRNMIYREVAMAVPVMTAKISCDTPEDVSAAIGVDHPLLKVCRQLRQEARPVIKAIAPLTAPKLMVRMDAFHFEKLSQLSDFLHAHSRHCNVDISGPKEHDHRPQAWPRDSWLTGFHRAATDCTHARLRRHNITLPILKAV